MRLHSIIVAGMLFAPVTAFAQEATPGAPAATAVPSLSPIVPLPREEAGVSGYHVIAIAAGAVVGVVAANFLTGGMITPILAWGTGTAIEPAMMMGGPMAAGAGAAVDAAAVAAPAAVAAAPEVAAAPAAGGAVAAVVEPVAAAAAAAPEAVANAAVPVVQTVGYAYRAGQAATLAVGAVVGGYVGNWIYGK